MSGNYEQWLLPILKFVPFVGSVGMLLYCLVTGKIPVRGRIISRANQSTNYWSVLALVTVFIVLPCFYFAVS